jgi:iron complex transport system substrate-binding protein
MTRPSRRAPRGALVLLTTLALVGAACGEDDDAGSDVMPETAASSPTSAAAVTVTSPSPTASDPATGVAGAAIDNCGVDVPVDAAPTRAVTMNQAATEVVLSLGLADRLIGTAYLDDEILPELAAAYATVPVVAAEYPSTEALLDTDPDFVYASYRSAFEADAAGPRGELADLGIGSYLSPAACPDRPAGEPLTFDVVFEEFAEVAEVFGVPEAGAELVAEQQAILDASVVEGGEDITVLWWDDGFDVPSAGACCGAPGMIMAAAGVENVAADVAGSWADISWEQVVAADPDVIVLIDASWSTAADKQAHLESDPALAGLTAVQQRRFVTIPFSSTTPGVRNASALGELAAGVEAFGPIG